MLAEPLAVTLQVVDALETLSIPYWIGGSLASALHGVARSTLDADLVAAIKREHVEAFVRALEPAFYVDEAMIQDAVLHRISFNLIHRATMFKVDIFVLKDRPFERSQFERREQLILATQPEQRAYVCTA